MRESEEERVSGGEGKRIRKREKTRKVNKKFLSLDFCPKLKIIQLIKFSCEYFSFTKFVLIKIL